MAIAVSYQPEDPPVSAAPVPLRLVRPGPRPRLARPRSARATIAAPTQAQHRRSVYWARRALAIGFLLTTVMAVAVGVRAVGVPAVGVRAVGVRAVGAGLGGEPLPATGSGSGVGRPLARGDVYVVQAGDSLWSIVRASGAKGDPRPAVDRLEREVGGASLQIGQQIVIP